MQSGRRQAAVAAAAAAAMAAGTAAVAVAGTAVVVDTVNKDMAAKPVMVIEYAENSPTISSMLSHTPTSKFHFTFSFTPPSTLLQPVLIA